MSRLSIKLNERASERVKLEKWVTRHKSAPAPIKRKVHFQCHICLHLGHTTFSLKKDEDDYDDDDDARVSELAAPL